MMLRIPNISRFRAAGIHLAISAAIAVAVVALMLALWYPPPLFGAMGGMDLILLVVGVDVVIGPLLTLIIFDTRKKELAFDLAVIAALQLSALTYGIYAMHAGRPVFIAFVEKRFAVVAANELEDPAIAKAGPTFRLPQTGPVLVAVDMPTNPAEIETILLGGLAGMGAQHLPQYYVAYAERLDRVLQAGRSLDHLAKLTPEEARVLEETIMRTGRSRGQLLFIPMVTQRKLLTALVDVRTGEFLAATAVDPVKP